MSSPPKVLICHPGRQHSHQAAIALQNADMLGGYWTGVPCLAAHTQFVPKFISRRYIRYSLLPLQKNSVYFFPVAFVAEKIACRFLPSISAKNIAHTGYAWFDYWASRKLSHQKIDAVMAYESSALETFRMAKQLRITTILDAASIHHQTQDKINSCIRFSTSHHKINLIKDEEIKLADYILTVSELARQTYIDAGVSKNKIYSLPLGADIDLFTPLQNISDHVEKYPFIFLFVGSLTLTKGIDILLEAFNRITKIYSHVYLKLVGGTGNAVPLVKKWKSKFVIQEDPLKQEQLAERYRNANCLILPSRYDSFGMVVAEALACGTPVIVSDMVGAKDLVIEGRNGWIVPMNDANSLAERMFWCIEHQNQLDQMKKKIRQLAEKISWSTYHKRLIEILMSILRAKKE